MTMGIGKNISREQHYFEIAGVRFLTSEQKRELKNKSAEYLKKVSEIRQEIDEHRNTISQLLVRINNERPSIPGATLVHSRCQSKTGIYYGQTPEGGLTGGEDLAYCLFCDEEYII